MMRCFFPALASTLAAVGLGCASVPPAPTPELVATELAARTGLSVSNLSAASPTWSAPPDVVIDDGVTIDEAVSAALWNNPDFHVALSSLGLARADLIEAGLIRNPILSLLFPAGPKQLEWTLSWPVDVLWQRPRRIEAASLAADVIAEQLVARGLQLIADVRLAWTDAEATDRALALAGAHADVARELTRLADVRLGAGDISELDARLVRTDAALIDARQIALTADRDRAVLRLRVLMGLPHDAQALRLSASAVPPTTCDDRTAAIESSLAARPDVRAAEIELEAAGARAGLERGRIMTLSASLDANAQGSEGFEMGPGLAVELPILSQNQGGKARAAAQLDEAARRYVAVRARIVAEVDDALIRYQQAARAADLLEGTIDASLETTRRQAESLYDAGEISLIDMLTTRQRLIEAERVRLDATLTRQRALIELERAVGWSCSDRR